MRLSTAWLPWRFSVFSKFQTDALPGTHSFSPSHPPFSHSIPVTNTSVNPARSTGPALFLGGWALGQLWLFWVALLIGGVLGGAIYRWLSDEPAGTVQGR
jgi:hypothetical protein